MGTVARFVSSVLLLQAANSIPSVSAYTWVYFIIVLYGILIGVPAIVYFALRAGRTKKR
jgi:hypothetical protein